jgi:hypothetical protein
MWWVPRTSVYDRFPTLTTRPDTPTRGEWSCTHRTGMRSASIGEAEAHGASKLPVLVVPERLGKDICDLVIGADIANHSLSLADDVVAHKVALARDVLGAGVELRIVREDDGGLVVTEQFSRSVLSVTNVLKEGAKPGEMLPGIAEADILGLGGRERDHGLALT